MGRPGRPPGEAHEARKEIFRRGLERGWVRVDEIDDLVPADALSPHERWMLLYSLRASGVEILGSEGETELHPLV